MSEIDELKGPFFLILTTKETEHYYISTSLRMVMKKIRQESSSDWSISNTPINADENEHIDLDTTFEDFKR